MSTNSQGRVVIGLCMDKERDEELLSFLSSKKNKSEFIRNLLYENLENLKNGNSDFSLNSSSLLNDISVTLRNILFTLNNSNDTRNPLYTTPNISTSQNIAQSQYNEYQELQENEPIDEDALILGAVVNSFDKF